MNTLRTNYLGIELGSPIIVSSSGLSNSLDKVKQMEKYGTGAIILKSLFEEQINLETSDLLKYNDYPEAEDYIKGYTHSNNLSIYLAHLKKVKEEVKTPIIASINCISSAVWTDFAKKIEDAGADALELNIHIIPIDKNLSAGEVEQQYIDIVGAVNEKIAIPLAVKISNQFTNLLNIADKLKAEGADSIVLFNRFYEPDIDIERFSFYNSGIFSQAGAYGKTLRRVGLLSGQIPDLEISATTGIHTAEDAIKLLLAGADTVQVCSVLYQNGIEKLKDINVGIKEWMRKKNFKNIESFKAKMSYRQITDPSLYERAQFMKYFSAYE